MEKGENASRMEIGQKVQYIKNRSTRIQKLQRQNIIIYSFPKGKLITDIY